MVFNWLTTEELIKILDNYKFNQIHIHHTWKPAHKNFTGENHEKLQQSIKDYHINTNGWRDIGQHVTLFPDGMFLTGRDFSKTPCSISGWNTNAFAVGMLGNFDMYLSGEHNDLGYDKLEGLQREAILKLANYFGEKYSYDSIKFHRDNTSEGKTCPGTSIDKNTFLADAKNVHKEDIAGIKVRIDFCGKTQSDIDGRIIDNITYVKAKQLIESLGFSVD